jgi:hypothetical protein
VLDAALEAIGGRASRRSAEAFYRDLRAA